MATAMVGGGMNAVALRASDVSGTTNILGTRPPLTLNRHFSKKTRRLLPLPAMAASLSAEEREQARADRRRQSFLEYEALKKDLSTTTIAVAAAVDAYTYLTVSPQTAISYAIGALGSYLYLQLLYQHADSVSAGNVAEIFQRRTSKKIGIRSSDVQESLEKTVRGCGIALSSPRLVIPAGLYTLWAFSTRLTGTSTDSFHLEVVPIMLGFFAYKAAALIQAYRDNKDLLLVISENLEDSSR